MRIAMVVSVISVVAVVLMIRSAIAVGFTMLAVPIVLAELIFLVAVHVLGRELGDDEGASEPADRVRHHRPRPTAERLKPARPATGVREDRLGARSLVGRTGSRTA